MRKFLLVAALFIIAAPAHAGIIDLPGFDFVIDRVKSHGFAGQAWDIKGRPSTTLLLTLNNKGPVYVTVGAQRMAQGDQYNALCGLQYDGLHLWRRARKIPLVQKMELIELPKDWRILAGPMLNITRVRPDRIRIDRDLIFNLSMHIGFGKGGTNQ